MPRVVALIPAKGRSRRAPGKNLAPLAGLPLFAHSVRLAQASTRVDEVVVSSDDDRILRLAQAMGARAWKRGEELCRDEVTNFEVSRSVLQRLRTEGPVDALVLLQPTQPFRTPEALDDGVAGFLTNTEADSMVTVVPGEQVLCEVKEGWLVLPQTTGPRLRNPAPPMAIVGHLVVVRTDRTLDRGSLLGERILPLPLPDGWLNVDIDTPDDVMIAGGVAQTFFERRFPIARHLLRLTAGMGGEGTYEMSIGDAR